MRKIGSLGFRLFLVFLVIWSEACIHTPRSYRERMVPAALAGKPDRSLISGSAQIHGLVYSQAELPLSDFFRRLSEGEFTEALKSFNLSYRPSNIYSSLVSDLIDRGTIPVYIEIKNIGAEPLRISERNFVLKHKEKRILALAADQVPNEIKSFSPQAALANTYNTVIVTLAVLTILLLLGASGGNHWPANGPAGAPGGISTSKSSESVIWNDTYPSTYIDYRDYLFSRSEIAPGEVRKGLIFFNYKHFSQEDELELLYLTP